MAFMRVKLIPQKDLKKAWTLECVYVERSPFSDFRNLYNSFSGLFIVAYDHTELIGTCVGHIDERGIIIDAIAVDYKYWRRGTGSNMLKFFEKRTKLTGACALSVGSARGYIRN